MIYDIMKKLILSANAKYKTKEWTFEQYSEYKNSQQGKIDVFFAKGRLTENQYNELTDIWIDAEPENADEVE